ncbi:MAG: hypothetical protein JJ714_11505 [Acidithiobacillus sp.]|nr:hypothetical protein [Acidithiobacillus sp.]
MNKSRFILTAAASLAMLAAGTAAANAATTNSSANSAPMAIVVNATGGADASQVHMLQITPHPALGKSFRVDSLNSTSQASGLVEQTVVFPDGNKAVVWTTPGATVIPHESNGAPAGMHLNDHSSANASIQPNSTQAYSDPSLPPGYADVWGDYVLQKGNTMAESLSYGPSSATMESGIANEGTGEVDYITVKGGSGSATWQVLVAGNYGAYVGNEGPGTVNYTVYVTA